MNLKKILLLSSMALAAIAFAVPSMASAEETTLTHNHNHVGAEEEIEQSFEGELGFDVAGVGSFGCEVTVTVVTDGPTTAEITEFEPTTSTCAGTGGFATCSLVDHTFNLPWHVETDTHHLLVTKTGDLEVHNFYNATCPVTQVPVGKTTRTLFEDITIEPILDEDGTILELEITEGNLDTGGGVTATGSVGLHVPSSPTLGLT